MFPYLTEEEWLFPFSLHIWAGKCPGASGAWRSYKNHLAGAITHTKGIQRRLSFPSWKANGNGRPAGLQQPAPPKGRPVRHVSDTGEQRAHVAGRQAIRAGPGKAPKATATGRRLTRADACGLARVRAFNRGAERMSECRCARTDDPDIHKWSCSVRFTAK